MSEPNIFEKVVNLVDNYGKGISAEIPKGPHDALEQNLAADRKLLESGVKPLTDFMQEHFGKSLDTLADPKSGPLDCAKAFQNLAGEVTKLSTPGGLVEAAGKHYLKEKLENLEGKYDGLKPAIDALKATHDGAKLGEKLEHDVKQLKADIGLTKMYVSGGAADGVSTMARTAELVKDAATLNADVHAAQKFIKEHAPAAHAPGPHAAGHGASGAGGFATGATTIGGGLEPAAPGANVTPSALDRANVGDALSVSNGRAGVEIHSQPLQTHDVQRPHAATHGR